MKNQYLLSENLFDPSIRAFIQNTSRLRSYQSDALRGIFDAVMSGQGGRFAVMFPRQSGKNETQAQLEAAIMAASQHTGGNIIKIIPTEKNQGKVSTERLTAVLRGTVIPEPSPTTKKERGVTVPGVTVPVNTFPIRVKKDEVTYGSAPVRCLSASPNSAIVGATADLLLEVDEAQMVPTDKYDREAAPMAASTNAVQVFWGTAWDDQTLLSRETRLARQEEEADGRKHVFTTTAIEVGKEVPEYERFVRQQIKQLSREHPAIRTQFFCEEITDLTSMFTADRMNRMKGEHKALTAPERDHCYVFLIDVAGSDEIQPKDKRAHGFSDRRDATVVTICDVTLPEGKDYDAKNFVWKVVGRRLFRNLPSEMLQENICQEIDLWDPRKIIIDHSGLGAMLCDVLSVKYKSKVYPVDITAANKTKMAWDFLAMVDTGRWIEHQGDEINVLKSKFEPGKERYEILREPELLQQMFYRELRACRIEPTGNPANVRWGVKEGTRDLATGRVLHDDLVMSAAMAVFENGSLSVHNSSDFERWAKHMDEIKRINQERIRKLRGYW
ncbi:MAG: hypothetical protein IJI41_01485 [Anaerolineaceae bacterium]|nr:hypothetical protein [Anaerolineaceae bacterium]